MLYPEITCLKDKIHLNGKLVRDSVYLLSSIFHVPFPAFDIGIWVCTTIKPALTDRWEGALQNSVQAFLVFCAVLLPTCKGLTGNHLTPFAIASNIVSK
jgi:hypothetical protein